MKVLTEARQKRLAELADSNSRVNGELQRLHSRMSQTVSSQAPINLIPLSQVIAEELAATSTAPKASSPSSNGSIVRTPTDRLALAGKRIQVPFLACVDGSPVMVIAVLSRVAILEGEPRTQTLIDNVLVEPGIVIWENVKPQTAMQAAIRRAEARKPQKSKPVLITVKKSAIAGPKPKPVKIRVEKPKPEKPKPPQGWLHVSEAALVAGVSAPTLNHHVRRGTLAAIKVPGSRANYLERAAIEKLYGTSASP